MIVQQLRVLTSALLAAAACAALPATASAGLLPVWQPAETISATDQPASYAGVMSASDGRMILAWSQSDGANERMTTRVRAADGTWGPVQFVSPEGEDIVNNSVNLTVGQDGVATYLWQSGSGAYMRVLNADGTWEDAISPALQSEQFYGLNTAKSPDGGSTLIVISNVSGDNTVQLLTRASGAASYSRTQTWDEPDSSNLSEPAIAFNAAGAAFAAWRVQENGGELLRYARRQSGSWGAATDGPVGIGQELDVAISTNGDVGAIWPSPSYNAVTLTSMDGGTGDWATPQTMPNDSPNAFFARLVADGSGEFVATWQAFDMMNYLTEPAHVFTSEWTAQTGTWSSPEQLDNTLGGAPFLTSNAAGDILLALGTGPDMLHVEVSAAFRPSGGTWSDVNVVREGAADIGPNGLVIGALGDDGNSAITFLDPTTDNRSVAIVLGDGAAPDIDSLSVPASGKVGQAVNVSASASDTLSGVDEVSWNFGDGGAAAGEDASHVYASPGSYTVTITVTDNAGHTTSQTRQISVTSSSIPQPPADDDEDTVVDDVKPPAKPPVVAAPIVEAKLAGKTVTYNAKLSLQKGRACSGTVTATFTFGNKRYTSKLKLKKVGTVCRATGKTTLKKSPSARTKITVKLSGKQVKTRSLSTKRA